MKQMLLLLATIFMVNSVNAQIEREFNGVVLGQSTKQDIINNLNRLGWPYEWDSKGSYINCKKDIAYGGLLWWGISYHISNNVVNKITFAKWETDTYFSSGIEEEFNYLLRYFLNTYGGLRQNGDYCYVLDYSTAVEAYKDTKREPGVLRLHFYDLKSKENRYKFGNMW